MPGVKVPRSIFKDADNDAYTRHTCPKCNLLLLDAVQPQCGHRICQSCADEMLKMEAIPCCPECGESFNDEDGAYVSTFNDTVPLQCNLRSEGVILHWDG